MVQKVSKGILDVSLTSAEQALKCANPYRKKMTVLVIVISYNSQLAFLSATDADGSRDLGSLETSLPQLADALLKKNKFLFR